MKTAFVFPGQGSQKVGMLRESATQNPLVKSTFNEASEVLGYDLWQLCQEGPEERLNSTEVTQPAILTASVALWRCWQSAEGLTPAMVAGHSLGEYSALVAAGSLDFADAVALVQKRALAMQAAVPQGQGSMAAILGLDDAQVQVACESAAQGQVVSAVNFNAPGQVVIAGHRDAVERAILACKEAGAKRAMALPVSVPSHCTLMFPAADVMAQALAVTQVRDAVIPVVQNVSAEATSDASVIADNLVKQLVSPVLWTDSVRSLAATGCNTLIECGPGRVLGGLVKRIDRQLTCLPLETPEQLQAALMQMKITTT
ncbi:MAG: [acyl-carrier-protein] S-malonyltransferase [Halomonadaceae bacterium]|nr:MAG: [acyl-carrier-protein] S-malonyltransferase [Halomonadaceae bacterium]